MSADQSKYTLSLVVHQWGQSMWRHRTNQIASLIVDHAPIGLVLVTATVRNFFSLSFYMMVPIVSIQSKMVSHVMYLCIGLKNPCQVYLCDILTVLYNDDRLLASWVGIATNILVKIEEQCTVHTAQCTHSVHCIALERSWRNAEWFMVGFASIKIREKKWTVLHGQQFWDTKKNP